MQDDERIQQTWLEMFEGMAVTSEPMVRRLGDGYYAAVLRPVSGSSSSHPVAVPAYERLKPFIPHLDRTRAVPLNGSSPLLGPIPKTWQAGRVVSQPTLKMAKSMPLPWWIQKSSSTAFWRPWLRATGRLKHVTHACGLTAGNSSNESIC
jgi:hypothetical protein